MKIKQTDEHNKFEKQSKSETKNVRAGLCRKPWPDLGKIVSTFNLLSTQAVAVSKNVILLSTAVVEWGGVRHWAD